MKRICLLSSVTAALCAATTALAQDECASAPTLVSGVASAFSTATATASAEPVSGAGCPGTYLNWDAAQQDVWFQWTATAGGSINVNTCDAASYDTSIVLYQGACGSLVEVACNGDAADSAGCQAYHSEIAGFAVSSGSTYFVRIGGYNAAVGAGNVTLTFTAGIAGCGNPGACNVVHATTGCEDLTCCNTVCNLLPFCCDTGWDQTCVDIAIPECGYYYCDGTGPANNCAPNATAISADGSIAFNSAGATMDGPNHDGGTCASGTDTFFNDLWWKFVAPANGVAAISSCGTTPYDNKFAVYDLGATPAGFDFNGLAATLVACNDDGSNCMLTDGVTPYASALNAVVTQGNTYLVRMGSYADGDVGAGSFMIDLPSACALAAHNKTEAEVCGASTNEGCNDLAGGAPVEQIALGDVVKGSFSTWIDATTGNVTRDLDWYRVNLTSDQQLTVEMRSETFGFAALFGGECGDSLLNLATTAAGCPESFSICAKAGSYFLIVGPDFDDGSLACGSGGANDYSVSVSGVAATCPLTLDTVCSAPGADSVSASVATTTTGNFVQGCATACGNNSGGSTDVWFATRFQGGNVLKEINCVNFGVAALRSQTPVGGACGYYDSDLLIPCRVVLWRDIDGGAPRNPILTAGDGNDLEEIASADVLVPSGVYIANLEFAEPLCVENETNLVFCFQTPNLYNGTVNGVPSGAGYRAGIGVSVPAPATGGNTYGRYTLCTGAGQNVFTPFGATSYEWPVNMNGSASACAGAVCPGDFNGDGMRDGADLGTLLAGWGTAGGDVNGDGLTDGADLGGLLAIFGTACP